MGHPDRACGIALGAIALLVACAWSAPPEPAPAGPTVEAPSLDAPTPPLPSATGAPMQLTIADTSDFAAAYAAYSSLVHGTEQGPQALELVFSPGTYRGQHLTLKDVQGRGRVALTLRSASAEPVVFTGMGLDLGGASVTLRGLVFEGSHGQGCALRVQARDAITMERVTFLDKELVPQGGRGGRVRAGLALLTATGPDTRLTVRDSWLVGNRLLPGQALLELEAQAGQGFGDVLLDGLVVVGNHGPLLSAGAPAEVLLRGSLVLLSPGVGTPVLLPSSAARLTTEGGLLHQDFDASAVLDPLRAQARLAGAPDIVRLQGELGI